MERVLKHHEHCIEVHKRNLVLTVRPCPPDLRKVVEKETPSSDGEGDGTGNSSDGEGGEVIGNCPRLSVRHDVQSRIFLFCYLINLFITLLRQ